MKKFKSVQNRTIVQLPRDVLIYMMQNFFSFKEITPLSQTCSFFYTLSKDAINRKKQILQKKINKIYSQLLKSKYSVIQNQENKMPISFSTLSLDLQNPTLALEFLIAFTDENYRYQTKFAIASFLSKNFYDLSYRQMRRNYEQLKNNYIKDSISLLLKDILLHHELARFYINSRDNAEEIQRIIISYLQPDELNQIKKALPNLFFPELLPKVKISTFIKSQTSQFDQKQSNELNKNINELNALIEQSGSKTNESTSKVSWGPSFN